MDKYTNELVKEHAQLVVRIDELEKEGYHVFMQSVPTSQKLSTEEIKDKFNK